jgi:hypothetical protein
MRLGSDPEIFLLDKGKPKSVCGLIGADKWNPLQVEGMAQGFTFQEDNVALEFGVPPAASSDEFVSHIQAVQEAFLSKYKHLTFSNLSCIVFPAKEMKHPGASIFGCEPDYNAWTGEKNGKPKPPHKYMRSAGGHIHVETSLDKRHVIQAMDLFLTIPSLLMDKGEERRKLYGKAGAYRPKSYGVEHRVLSNFWILKKEYIEWVWRNTSRALKAVEQGWNMPKEESDYLVQAIDMGDHHMAQVLIGYHNLEIV